VKQFTMVLKPMVISYPVIISNSNFNFIRCKNDICVYMSFLVVFVYKFLVVFVYKFLVVFVYKFLVVFVIYLLGVCFGYPFKKMQQQQEQQE
jgi:hypothetical protein